MDDWSRGLNNSTYDNINYQSNIVVGEVISVDDPNLLGRIKVRVKGARAKGGDDGISDDNLPWCLPLIPKLLSLQPKIKEAVFIFTFSNNKQFIDRLYIGPIISQSNQLQFDPYYTSAFAGFSFGSEAPKVAINTIPELRGVFPNPQDVSIQGRYNTDITQKNNEIVLRAGKFIETPINEKNVYPFSYNSVSQGYIQIKNDVTLNKDTEKQGTVVNLVGNKINLLSHGGLSTFNTLNRTDLISKSEMANILENAHPMVFGDVLIEYLKLMKDAVLNHYHNHRTPTDLKGEGNKQSVATFKERAEALEAKMLSQNIRIN